MDRDGCSIIMVEDDVLIQSRLDSLGALAACIITQLQPTSKTRRGAQPDASRLFLRPFHFCHRHNASWLANTSVEALVSVSPPSLFLSRQQSHTLDNNEITAFDGIDFTFGRLVSWSILRANKGAPSFSQNNRFIIITAHVLKTCCHATHGCRKSFGTKR